MARSLGKKNIAVLIFWCLAQVICIAAGSDEENFLRAHKYYAEKDYEKALQSYMDIDKKGRAVLYNIGNCLFHQEDYPGALVYWSRAEKGASSQEYNLIMHNKDCALKKLNKVKNEDLLSKSLRWWQLKMPYISPLLLQLLFLICWWIFCMKIPGKPTRLKKIIQSLLCLCIIIFAIILSLHYKKNNVLQAIVIQRQAQLFSGPNKSFHMLSDLAYADNVTVKEAREGWYKIEYADMIGWVEQDVIQII